MSSIKTIVKNTPLYQAWWNIKEIPPFSQVYNGMIHKRRDHIYSVLPRFYDAHRSEPIEENKVIFVENRYPSLSDNYRLIYKELKKQGSWKIHVHLLREHSVSPREHDENCARLLADAATAKYIFLNDISLPLSAINKRPETVIVQLWHACGAFKKFGMSTADLRFGDSAAQRQRHPGYRNLNYVTVSSEQIAWAYREAMGLEDTPDIVHPVGVSRTDVFFDQRFHEKALEKLHRLFPGSENKNVILYAPTFRGRPGNALTPDFETFHLQQLKESLGEDSCIIIRQHPYIKPENTPVIPEELKGTFALDLTKKLTVEESLCCADMCITDYSSLIFEYLLLNRPMLFYAYDLDDYNDWRGFYYPYEQMTPGPVCRTMDELTGQIKNLLDSFDPESLIEFRERFMSACDGHATERIMEMVFSR